MNLLPRAALLTLLQLLCASPLAGGALPTGWEERFADPPAAARILKIIHSWPDSPDAQDQQIARLRTQGFGGVVCNVSGKQNLESEPKWQAFTRAVNEAKRAGLAMWLYDERGYPSGNAGGITLREHADWEARGLLVADTESSGGDVTLDLPPGKLVLAAAGNGERWNPATGKCEERLSGSIAKLILEPYGAAVFRFASATVPARRKATSGALPNLSLHPVPRAEPTVMHGEFVRAEVVPDAAPATKAPVWQARAVLTRSEVDTFLFAQVHYAQPLDLSAADCLALETRVPDGQSTPNQLLVILHEQDGGDFVVETGRSLAAPGRERSFIPLNRFQLAGWSTDADGVLDLKRVADIRIGWGGYPGTEGEEIQFGVALPQAGNVVGKQP